MQSRDRFDREAGTRGTAPRVLVQKQEFPGKTTRVDAATAIAGSGARQPAAPDGQTPADGRMAAAAERMAAIPALSTLFGKRAVQQESASSVGAQPTRAAGAEPATRGEEAAIHGAAERGVATAVSALPHRDAIQRAFGRHDVSAIRAHVGSDAAASARDMDAMAYATGDHIVFGQAPDLRTAAHEAAHVVQQRGGVSLASGIGQVGDRHEQHADAVADLVIQGRSVEALLDEHIGGRGAQPALAMPATQRSAIQRLIVIHPAQFFAGIGVNGDEGQLPTAREIREYVELAVRADADRALVFAKGEERATQIERALEHLKDPPDIQEAMQVLEDLVGVVNQVLLEGDLDHAKDKTQTMNSETRYAAHPAKHTSYSHPEGAPTWEGDHGAQVALARALGGVMDGSISQSRARGQDCEPVVKLDWLQARAVLPAPLINLIFDVRYQLELAPQGWSRRVIDERSDDEQNRRNTTPDDPGTLRSWHEDSAGLLPDNGFPVPPKNTKSRWTDTRKDRTEQGQDEKNGKKKSRNRKRIEQLSGEKEVPGPPNPVPEGSRLLDAHYKATSGTGAGASIKGIDGPRGYAEYTGAGSNNAHNIKLVLDYMAKRVYLSMTHYTYWAIYRDGSGGEGEFFDCQSQEKKLANVNIRAAQDGTGNYKGNPILKGKDIVLMSPWLEIAMPTRETFVEPGGQPPQDDQSQDERPHNDSNS